MRQLQESHCTRNTAQSPRVIHEVQETRLPSNAEHSVSHFEWYLSYLFLLKPGELRLSEMVNLMLLGIRIPVQPGSLRQDRQIGSSRSSRLGRTRVFRLQPHQVEARLALPDRDDS